jgi:hypothetical protein
MQGPLVPGYTYVRDKTPEQIAQEAADAQAKANASMPTGGSGYRLDPDTAHEVITEIESILDWIKKDLSHHSQTLMSFMPMGDEVASMNYVQDLNAAGRSYNTFLNSVITEFGRQKDVIQQALNTYQKQEQQAAEQLKGTVSRHV